MDYHMAASWSGGTPKWLVYNGNSHSNGCFGSSPLMEIPIWKYWEIQDKPTKSTIFLRINRYIMIYLFHSVFSCYKLGIFSLRQRRGSELREWYIARGIPTVTAPAPGPRMAREEVGMGSGIEIQHEFLVEKCEVSCGSGVPSSPGNLWNWIKIG